MTQWLVYPLRFDELGADPVHGVEMAPQVGQIVDRASPREGVTDLSFTDQDLDKNKVGGVVSWKYMPMDNTTEAATAFNVYFAPESNAHCTPSEDHLLKHCVRSLVDTVYVGTNDLVIPTGTRHNADRRYLIVYVRNDHGEQSSLGASVRVGDLAVYGCLRKSVDHLLDKDLCPSER